MSVDKNKAFSQTQKLSNTLIRIMLGKKLVRFNSELQSGKNDSIFEIENVPTYDGVNHPADR